VNGTVRGLLRWSLLGFGAGLCGLLQAQQVELQPGAPPMDARPLAFSVTGRALATETTGFKVFGPQEYRSQWPGTYFEAAFKGGDLWLRFGANHAIVHVVVDGKAPLVLKPAADVYHLSGLGKGMHRVRVAEVSEDQNLPTTFGGMAIAGSEEGFPVSSPERQIEFVGDSHTVGYGNTSTKGQCTTEEVWATTDDAAAFGALTAAHYDAAYQVNAISGRGVVRNYNGFAADTLPEAYPYVLFDRKQRYADARWKPEVVIVALGTNDFSTALNAGETWKTRDDLHRNFEATYLRFLQAIRQRDPQAYLIVWATDMANGEIAAEAGKVVEQMRQAGETRIAFVPVKGLAFTGCHGHPSLADDQVIAGRLEQAIDAVPGVWQGK
jgi:lysophospholipase L1-like esterase